MKLFKRIIKYLLILIGGAGLAIVIAINVSPRPFVFFLNHAAKDEAAIRPRAYQSYRDQISIKKDVRYSSQSAKNTMDIFYKKDNRTKPTIIWAHGGAFVAGDKLGTIYWATKMAANGYNVVSINYTLAPDRQYPTQVNQMREAIQFVHRNYAKQLNVQKVVVGGDSAGAHIASQVIAAQYNHQLATAINYHHLRDVKIVGGLLYCGPYDIKQMVNKKHVDTMTKLFRKLQ
jgi:acetyl esterase/lipase